MRKRIFSAGAIGVLVALSVLIFGTTSRAGARAGDNPVQAPVQAGGEQRPLPLPSDLPAPLPTLPDIPDLPTATPAPSPTPTPTVTPAPVEADFSWWLVPRAERFRRGRAFDASTRSYDPGYVYPDGWRVIFDACDSSGGDRPIRDYTWAIEGLDVPDFHHTVTLERCNFDFSQASAPIPRPCVLNPDLEQCQDLDLPDDWQDALPTPPIFPQQGRYRVRLTVRNGDFATDSVVQEIEVQDRLIVSVGDSNAAGEGNPDVPADWDLAHVDLSQIDVEGPIWQDPPCNRSRTSGPVFAAQQIEDDDPHSTVTFLSFACSGATLADITEQIDAVHALLCGDVDDCREDVRPIDALFISGGVNDLKFSSVIKICSAYDKNDIDGSLLDQLLVPYERAVAACDDRLAGMVNSVLFGIYNRYETLDEHIDALEVEQVYITEYPTEVFYNDDGEAGGCDAFNEISRQEAEWITEIGGRLNFQIQSAADAFGWNYVGGIADGFRGHGYCTEEPWFRALSDSLTEQLEIRGAVHPTRNGHEVTADRLVALYYSPKPDRTLTRRVTVTFEQVRVEDDRARDFTPELDVRLAASNGRLPREAFVEELAVTPGEWVDLPEGTRASYELAVGDTVRVHAQTTIPPVLGIHPKTFESIVLQPAQRLVINRSFGRDEGYGAGDHETTAGDLAGSISVRYHIDVEPIR